jgi:hydroxypyruvate isomerase
MEFCWCIEMASPGLAFIDRFAVAEKVGLKHVEMWFVDASFKGTPQELDALAAKHKLRINNTVIGSPDGAIGGGLTNPAQRDQWLERARMTLDYTKAAGIGATIVCTGNNIKGMSATEMRDSVTAGLAATLPLAKAAGITMLLEPLNDRHDHPDYFLTSNDLGARICRDLNSPNLRLLCDIYHMHIMEGDLLDHINNNLDVIGHFHSAGVPGRHELYGNEINYQYLVSEIRKLDYKGLFTFEYAPTMPSEESLRRVIDYLETAG